MINRISAILICLFCAFTASAQTPNPFTIGEIKILKSTMLAEERTLFICRMAIMTKQNTRSFIYWMDLPMKIFCILLDWYSFII